MLWWAFNNPTGASPVLSDALPRHRPHRFSFRSGPRRSFYRGQCEREETSSGCPVMYDSVNSLRSRNTDCIIITDMSTFANTPLSPNNAQCYSGVYELIRNIICHVVIQPVSPQTLYSTSWRFVYCYCACSRFGNYKDELDEDGKLASERCRSRSVWKHLRYTFLFY